MDNNTTQKSLWNERYNTEGAVWGWQPSETALMLEDELASASKVLEVGFGYGRDIVELAKHGHIVEGIEESTVGLSLAVKELEKYGRKANLTFGEFTTTGKPKAYYDAVLSHRVLHLLSDNGLVRAFASSAARVLKPGGLLYISARDERDFDPDQMNRLEDGRATYKDSVQGRKGHIISFWNEKRFEDAFSKKFNILSFRKGEEIESLQNSGKLSHYTIMVAERRATPAPSPRG